MHKSVISDSLKALKKRPEIFLYSLEYTVIIMIFSFVENFAFHKTMIWEEWSFFGINNTLLYFIFSFILQSIEAIILTSLVYMMLNNKMKFKRFFYFMDIKNAKYNILFSLLVILPTELFKAVLNSGLFESSLYFAVPILIVFFIAEIFSHLMICFKAGNKAEDFKIIFGKTVKFITDSFGSLFVFYLKFFIPIQIIFLILSKCMYELIAEDVIFYVLQSVNFGIDIFFIPLYFLCLHNLQKAKAEI